MSKEESLRQMRAVESYKVRQRRKRKKPESPSVQEQFFDPALQDGIHARASLLLDPHKDHKFFENLARQDGVSYVIVDFNEESNDSVNTHNSELTGKIFNLFFKKDKINNQLVEQQLASQRAQNGIDLLEKFLKEPDNMKRLEKIRPFDGIAYRDYLRRLTPELQEHLSLINLIVGDFVTMQPEGNTEGAKVKLIETKVEIFAAAVGMAQEKIVDPERRDMKGWSDQGRQTMSNAILLYGVTLLDFHDQKIVKKRLYQHGKDKGQKRKERENAKKRKLKNRPHNKK